MATTHQFTEAAAALRFLLGGNAILTMKSKKTGERYTFRVSASDDGKLSFVSYLTGSDNESDYSYVGIIRAGGVADLQLTKKSRLTAESTPVKAFRWVLAALIHNILPPGVELWHEGRCGRCGRTLTVPESIASGFGPECITKIAGAA
jgi:hypothetical protein